MDKPRSRRVLRKNPVFVRRIKELMDEQGTTAGQVAAAAGLGNTAVYDILSFKSKRPMQDILIRISEALKVDVAYLIGVSNNRRVAKEPSRLAIPVIGVAETDAWHPMPKKTGNRLLPLRMIDGVPHPQYPAASHFALDVADEAMSNVGIIPGTQVLCIEVAGVNGDGASAPIESGRIYAIRLSDRNYAQQTVIRRIILHKDRFELRPDSASKRYRPLSYPGKPSTNPRKDICVFGLVYRVERDLTHL
jgi:transcriptional regulator with XRE-family HTH domain